MFRGHGQAGAGLRGRAGRLRAVHGPQGCPADARHGGGRHHNFADTEITGSTVGPDGQVFFYRKQPKHNSMIHVRDNFTKKDVIDSLPLLFDVPSRTDVLTLYLLKIKLVLLPHTIMAP